MTAVNINGQSYEVHEEVADQFSKFIRISKAKDADILAGLKREEVMLVTIDDLNRQLKLY